MTLMHSVNFAYDGMVLLVVADMMQRYEGHHRASLLIGAMVVLYLIANVNLALHQTRVIPFEAYISYYNAGTQSILLALRSACSSLNTILFVSYIVLLIKHKNEERARIRLLNEKLEEANTRLRAYAIHAGRMPELDGVLATKAVKAKYPAVRIIILTTFDDDDYVYSALKYGASGYLLKGGSVQELADAIRIVVSGGNILNPDVTSKVVKLFSQMAQGAYRAESDLQGVKELTHTERSIAQRVGRGLSNKEIAGELSLSEGTVRNSLSTALSKLNLRDRTQLALWAVQIGLSQMRGGGSK